MQAPPKVIEPPRSIRAARIRTGGVEGNELLTASTGVALMVLLGVIGVTILALGRLLSVHLFVGMLLVGPLALKLASTGYRFARYYTGSVSYRRHGPPPMSLRLMAPMVVASTLVVMASGVALLLAGPSSRDTLLPIHKASFILWIAFTSLHVLGHLRGVGRALRREFASVTPPPGGTGGSLARTLSLMAALAIGLIIAVLLIPDYGPWLHAQAIRHH
jgi:thiosulfate reductase cytochrome b subunit